MWFIMYCPHSTETKTPTQVELYYFLDTSIFLYSYTLRVCSSYFATNLLVQSVTVAAAPPTLTIQTHKHRINSTLPFPLGLLSALGK